MESGSKSKFLKQLQESAQKGLVPEKHLAILRNFYASYTGAIPAAGTREEQLFLTYFDLFLQQLKSPFPFQPLHRQIRAPFDYYAFGIDFMKPLVDLPHSRILGQDHLQTIDQLVQAGDNVILFSNHQIEADPQAIGILLEPLYPELASHIYFVAGERVITDPLAVPFSMGCNLFCIYSKRYIDHPPEEKLAKQLHNKSTMELMSASLREGGHCIWVAPSGGRDRRNAAGVVDVAPFDPQSIEMFYLMARRAEKPTHFFPMALSTYALLPPPETVQHELGEQRQARQAPIGVAVGAECSMELLPESDDSDKHARRAARAQAIWQQVVSLYARLPQS